MKNVVLLTIDVLREDVVGLYGHRQGLTPFLDSLRGNALLFTRCRSTGPYTQAAFPGLLASSYFLEYGTPRQLSPQRTLVSEVVKRGGFATAAFHSNAYLSEYAGWNRGWDYFYDSMQERVTEMVPYIPGAALNRKVDNWLQSYLRRGAGRPFFLWVHYMDVHEPYVPEEKWLQKIDPRLRLSKQEMLLLFKGVLLPRRAVDPAEVDTLRKLYQAHVLEVDEYVRGLFGVLEQHGMLGNSIVIITADHGEEFGEHGGLSHDGKMYAELINVPLIVYQPDREEGRTIDTVVSGVDIAPTVASLFDLAPADNWHGQSLLPVESYASRGAFGEAIGKRTQKIADTDGPVHFYQQDCLKIIHCKRENTWELYDLEEDPQERNNLVEESAATDDMKNQLRSRITWPLPGSPRAR